MKTLPQGVSSDIVVQALDDELLVYFLKTNRAICLNKTAAVVFNACNGVKTLVELRREHKFTDDLIFLALDELRRNDLLENYQSTYFAGLSRREAVKRAGLATMIALPVIAQLVAPRAGEAASRAQLLANGGFQLVLNAKVIDAVKLVLVRSVVQRMISGHVKHLPTAAAELPVQTTSAVKMPEEFAIRAPIRAVRD